MLVNYAQRLALPRAGFAFPLILRLGVGDRLPLEIGNRIRSAAGERLDVIFAVAWTGAAGFPSRWARMLPLELACYLTGSVLFRRNRSRGEGNRSRNEQGQHGSLPSGILGAKRTGRNEVRIDTPGDMIP